MEMSLFDPSKTVAPARVSFKIAQKEFSNRNNARLASRTNNCRKLILDKNSTLQKIVARLFPVQL